MLAIRHFLGMVTLGLALTFAPAGGRADGPVYTVGVVPQFEAMRLASIWLPIIDELEARTGYRFTMSGAPNIPIFERRFRDGVFDFAYMNPYHALMASDFQGYDPVVRDGDSPLYGVLVVHRDSRFRSPDDLADQTIAFPAPNALAASLMMRSDLTRRFGLTYAPLYAATHSSAYLNVVLGRAAAAGGVMGTFNSQPDDVRAMLRIIHETTRVAPHPLVVHPRVPPEVARAVQQAFLDIGQTEAGRAMLARIPMRNVTAATAEDYQSLKDMALEQFVE